jgi:glycosyltransferase involved in cell wall biosynthesis
MKNLVINSMKISVCMAVYNGQRYLNPQLQSILKQLRDFDELIIINDCSVDNSWQILNNCQDSRIKLFNNQNNLGVIKTFEKSLSKATGDIIFLSDQDDLWLPQKVEKILEVFRLYPENTLVLSDAQIIDSNDNIIAESFFKIRGKFTDNPFGNWVKSKYHGCTLAFRREMLDLFLPFPDDTPMHDIWIGIINSIYGKTFYINEPLIQHRRHDRNTGRGMFNPAGIWQIINWRLVLLKNIIILFFRNRLKQLQK